MTNIYCYCLFDGNGNFQGVYSSTAAVHRDAMKLCNKGHSPVLMDLMEADLEYVFIETDFAPTYRTQLKKQYRRTTFPIIIGESGSETLIIGGHDDLCLHLDKGCP